MSVDVKLPNLGENVSSGDISTILVNVGDRIEAQQDILEIETDKAVVPIPCSSAGVVAKIHVQRGQTVTVGQLLISLDSEQSAAAAPSAPSPAPSTAANAAPPAATKQPVEPPQAAPAAAPTPAVAPTPAKAVSHTQPSAPATAASRSNNDDDEPAAPAGPATRKLARELGVELKHVRGTGPNNRITRDDVVAAVRQRGPGAAASTAARAPSTLGNLATPQGFESQDDWGSIRREPMAKIRKTIAAKMVESATTIPHVTNYDDADITELERIRKSGITDFQGAQVKLTMMPFIMKAVSHALRLHPAINASLDMEKGEVVYKQYVHLGVAVDSERGLVVPVVRGVDQLSIPQIAQALTSTVEKVRSSTFAVEDLRGGTFTISNLGAIGGTYSTPIINSPEVAILLVGRSRKMPVVVDDQIQIRLMMPLSLSYDHRLVDGAMAARFLTEIISFLQNPGRLLLTP